MRRRQKPVTLGPIRLYHDQEPDRQLIDWLRQFDAQPYGVKSRAVKAALARGIGTDGEQLREAIGEALDLGEIRQVVEAAIASALSQFGVPPGTGRQVGSETSHEAETFLDRLGEELLLTEDDL